MRRCWIVVVLVALCACGVWRPVIVPMASISEPARCATKATTLIVMLPGSFSRPEEFQREGFVQAVRERRIAADVRLVDAHLGYYSDKSIIDRIQADIVAPARAQGYTQIWLVGISAGAFGALIHTEAQPAGITGIVALGPYLGKRAMIEEVAAQGGLRSWRAPSGPLEPDEVDAKLWRWLQAHADASAPPLLYLGYGRADRFTFGDELLAAAMPAARVYTTDGGHDWPPWRALWQRMLDAMPLPVDASCAFDR
jgi:pimeloyl-ACP methyl ester carboxylesterase